jgi:putative Holliday junction resolvase
VGSPADSTAKRYLALDPGERRTGLAATDWTGTLNLPLGRLEHASMDEVPELLAPIVAERQTEVIVVGLPLRADGTAGPQAQRVQGLVARLRARFPQQRVVTEDESLTTGEAHEMLKEAGIKAARRKRQADELAALAILRRHLGDAT